MNLATKIFDCKTTFRLYKDICCKTVQSLIKSKVIKEEHMNDNYKRAQEDSRRPGYLLNCEKNNYLEIFENLSKPVMVNLICDNGKKLDISELAEKVLEDVNRHIDNVESKDDLAFFVIKYDGG